MPKSPAQTAGIPLGGSAHNAVPNRKDPAWAAWQAHVDAGRIGSRTVMTAEQRLQLARNEMIVCGYRVLPNRDSAGVDASSRQCHGFIDRARA